MKTSVMKCNANERSHGTEETGGYHFKQRRQQGLTFHRRFVSVNVCVCEADMLTYAEATSHGVGYFTDFLNE